MTEGKKALAFFLLLQPWRSIARGRRILSAVVGGDLGEGISRAVLYRAELPSGRRAPKALLPSAETQKKILQAIKELDSVYTLGNEKFREAETISLSS
jgi:hypothetical protein